MKNLDVFLIFLIVRLISVYVIQTFFVPDEYWQLLEVAHNLVYDYGHLTWEWSKGIRSYIPPLFVAGLYKLLNLLGIYNVEALIYTPRIIQAVISAYSDLCFYKWSGTRKWAVFSLATSWFWFYTASRTLINTLECSITTIALSKFPWPGKGINNDTTFLWLLAILFCIRPTCAIVWIPLCIYHLSLQKVSLLSIFVKYYIPIGISTLAISTVIDSLVHGRFIVTPYEFLKFNVFQNIGSFYGVEPWHWYLSVGFPVILGIQFLPFVLACLVVLKNRAVHPNELIMLGTVVHTITIYSLFSHKEYRFILPLLPLVFYVSSRFLSAWSRKASWMAVWTVALVIFIGNAIPSLYLGIIHQRGTLDVMKPLREISQRNPHETSLLFLMPCHSTPLYSHLHVNVTTRFLTCVPNLNNIDNYEDEADVFYKNPNSWLRQNYPPNGILPSHIIIFDSLEPQITDILSRYKRVLQLFHTDVPLSSSIGRFVLVFERIDF